MFVTIPATRMAVMQFAQAQGSRGPDGMGALVFVRPTSSCAQAAARRPAQWRILRIVSLAVRAEAVLVAAVCTKATFVIAV